MPYRVDLVVLSEGDDAAFDRLVELGALDVEVGPDRAVAALLPDRVTPAQAAAALGVDGGVEQIRVSAAAGRDTGSVWVLEPRAVQVGRVRIVPADAGPDAAAVRLIDAAAFGTGLHPTTALCLAALDDILRVDPPATILDVGTGSGVLALAALTLGAGHATAIDIDEESLRAAAENARINGVEDRLHLVRGGPETITGRWPLVLANILAAPLIEMAPALVQRVGHHGGLLLSGIPQSVEPDVERAYRHLGMRRIETTSRAGWVALVLQASW